MFFIAWSITDFFFFWLQFFLTFKSLLYWGGREKEREKKLHSCAFFPRNVFHSVIRSAEKDVSGYPFGNKNVLMGIMGMFSGLVRLEVEETKTSGNRGFEYLGLDGQQSTVNHLIVRKFLPCCLYHIQGLLGEDRHIHLSPGKQD